MRRSVRAFDACLACLAIAVILLITATCSPVSAQEVLPSWNDTSAKTRITDFVRATTTEGGEAYVAPENRIAVFDNDGTLWSEQPVYIQLAFVFSVYDWSLRNSGLQPSGLPSGEKPAM